MNWKKGESNKAKLARTTALAGAVVAAASAVAGNAMAQQQQQQQQGTQAQASQEEAIVVTGSRIPQPNLQTTNPVTQVTAEDITTQGVTRLEDMTNQLPQVFAAQGSMYSNGASGTAQINLRGLGSTRSLVLIDGRRMSYGSPNSVAADLNEIPGAMVERVEILTGGASAVYGSDAIAGVVNFIMRDNFEGLRFDGQYGYYEHDNSSDDGYIRQVIAARALTNPSQFQLPEDHQDDGFSKDATFIFGASSPDGRGNVTAYVGYRNNSQIMQRDRDYSACTLGNPSTAAVAGVPAGAQHWTCGGSSTSYPGRFFIPALGGASRTIGNNGTFIPFNANLNQYNFGPLNFYQRPDERYTLGAFAHYQVTDHIDAYTQLMFSDYNSTAQIAPSGDFINTSTINCGNPLLSGQQASLIGCTATDITNNTTKGLYIARRDVEGGGRQDEIHLTSYRVVGGIRGPITDNWDYDISATYAHVALNRIYHNDFSVTRLKRALNVVDTDPGPGVTPTCQSVVDGTDPDCVPWNIFTLAGQLGGVNGLIPGGPTAASINYLAIPLEQQGFVTTQDVLATATGQTGITSPWAETAIGASVGAEYRRDFLQQTADASFASGDGAGQGGPTLSFPGAASDVFELFGEVNVPLVEHQPFADLISVNAAYRWSDYSNGVTTDTYNVGADWAPISDIRFRGSFAHAVRAPNIIELFSPQGAGLFNMAVDPCDATAPLTYAGNAACVSATPAPWQTTAANTTSGTLSNPANQYNGLFGGNPNLGPETADTTTFGIVLQPSMIPGFNLTVDYFHIDSSNLVGVFGASNTASACYYGGDPVACARITRNPTNGRLWTGTGIIQDLNINLTDTSLETKGEDIAANFRHDLGGLGGMNIQFLATHLDFITGGGTLADCTGFFNGVCGTPNPEWRYRLRGTWTTPWDLDLTATVRYYSSVDQVNGSGGLVTGRLDSHWDAQTYLDLAGTWQMRDNTRFRFGVNNVLDRDPPLSNLVPAGAGNGNTFPQVYDAVGRWVFAGVTVDW